MSTYAKRLVRRLFAAVRPRNRAHPAGWANDPFSDPALRAMTLAQLADIPFERPPAPESPLTDRTTGDGHRA